MARNDLEMIEILLVEDNPGDIKLTQKAIERSKLLNNLNVVMDGEQAIDHLYKRNGYENVETPDLIILDLNLPKVGGKEVLKEIKLSDEFCHIPVVVLTTSNSENDILSTYKLHANCYIAKPIDFNEFRKIVDQIQEFWFSIVKLPKKINNA